MGHVPQHVQRCVREQKRLRYRIKGTLTVQDQSNAYGTGSKDQSTAKQMGPSSGASCSSQQPCKSFQLRGGKINTHTPAKCSQIIVITTILHAMIHVRTLVQTGSVCFTLACVCGFEQNWALYTIFRLLTHTHTHYPSAASVNTLPSNIKANQIQILFGVRASSRRNERRASSGCGSLG